MDKLKENAFALALGGVGVVLLLVGYFLVYSQWTALRQRTGDAGDAVKSLSKHERQELLPTADLVEFYGELQDEERKEYQEGVDFYDRRTASFKKFFNEQDVPPPPDAFYSIYYDKIWGEQGLLKTYQAKYNLAEQIAATGEPIPKLEGIVKENVEVREDNIPITQKQYWIVEAIFAACNALDLGGLKRIEFKPERQERRSSKAASRRRGAEKEEPPFDVEHIKVDITIAMRFTNLKKFLGSLYENATVPFVDASKITVKKDDTQLASYKSLVRVVHEDPKSSEPKKTFDEIAPEPEVLVEMQLRALDWNGPRAPKESETEN